MFLQGKPSPVFSFGRVALVLFATLALNLPLPSFAATEAEAQQKTIESAPLPPGGVKTLTVYANKLWQNTGVDVEKGITYTITAEGRWSVGPVCGESDADGTGVNAICIGDEAKIGWRGSSMIGKIGRKTAVGKKAEPFKVGKHLIYTADKDGPLFLRAAYLDEFYFVNYGSMNVTIIRNDGYVPPRQESYAARPSQPPQQEVYAKKRVESTMQAPATPQPSQMQVRDITPPEITLLSPQPTRGIIIDARNEMSVIGFATDESGIMSVLVNNVEAELTKLQDRTTYKLTVALRPTDERLLIKAIDSYGNISEKSISIQRETVVVEKARPASVPGSKPNLWILAVGISRYQDKSLNLKYADNDAKSIAEMMKKQEGTLYKEVNYRLLLNEDGTRENILEGISKYLGMASYDDLVLIFMAGHGVKDKQTGSYYFLPYDANPDTLMTRGLLWSTFDEAQKRLASNVSKIMLWLDTCHAGAMQVAMRGAEAGEELSQELKSAEGTYIIAASKPGEDSEESKDFRLPNEEEGHGVFTYSLLEGLATQAADMDGNKSVTISELSSYVAKQVPRLTKGRQHPYFRQSGTDAPIFTHER